MRISLTIFASILLGIFSLPSRAEEPSLPALYAVITAMRETCQKLHPEQAGLLDEAWQIQWRYSLDLMPPNQREKLQNLFSSEDYRIFLAEAKAHISPGSIAAQCQDMLDKTPDMFARNQLINEGCSALHTDRQQALADYWHTAVDDKKNVQAMFASEAYQSAYAKLKGSISDEDIVAGCNQTLHAIDNLEKTPASN